MKITTEGCEKTGYQGTVELRVGWDGRGTGVEMVGCAMLRAPAAKAGPSVVEINQVCTLLEMDENVANKKCIFLRESMRYNHLKIKGAVGHE